MGRVSFSMRSSARQTAKMAFDEEASGVLPPVGYWDPLGTYECFYRNKLPQNKFRVSNIILFIFCYALKLCDDLVISCLVV